jgi:hypothetical protein
MFWETAFLMLISAGGTSIRASRCAPREREYYFYFRNLRFNDDAL